jgi:hypothetical protein
MNPFVASSRWACDGIMKAPLFIGLMMLQPLMACGASVDSAWSVESTPVPMPSLEVTQAARWIPEAPEQALPMPGEVTLVEIWHPS